MLKVLLLGYDQAATPIAAQLAKRCDVFHSAAPVTDLSNFDLTISYGYRYIITGQVLRSAPRPPINLHISYLPYNRGAHPNFWSWMDDTPAGYTIHHIDEGVDTGDIVLQERLALVGDDTTFETTYMMLRQGLERLFFDSLDTILNNEYDARPQQGPGTCHKSRDLPDWVRWDMAISEARKQFLEITR